MGNINKGVKSLLKIRSPTSESVQQDAVIDLIRRLLPDRVDEFEVIINTSLLNDDYKDKFTLESVGNKLKITATSGVSAANGLNYYLKYFANCHISWSGDQLNVPSPLPNVKTPVHMIIQDKFRYYQNVCTASYSMVWWDFKRWEREIDWMALRGINLPLAFNGQELIWLRVYKKFGFTEDEINDYFTGPAFLAWNRMGNIQGWSGPLTDNWHEQQALLQTQILRRMRDLGMLPVLPAFAGHVPKSITRVFPNAKVSKLTNWGGFNEYSHTTFLEPDDEHFQLIGSAFIDEYKNTYGTDHFYNTDLFNEMIPRTADVKYLSDCGKAVYQSLSKSDPQSIWVMQGWIFVHRRSFWQKDQAKALLTSVPQGKLLILDLMSEHGPVFQVHDGYYGQPFIWCMLHNFGGTLGLIGSFDQLNSDVFNARKNYSSMIGIGLTPEGIEQNDIIYDFMMETTWYTSPVDLDKWVSNYTHRRYGFIDNDLIKAWHLLQNSVYINTTNIWNFGRYVLLKRPDPYNRSVLWYKPSDVYKAFQLFIKASVRTELKALPTFEYDLVDITRQNLQLIFDDIFYRMILSFKNSDKTDFLITSKMIIDVLDDLNAILSTNKHFLLGNWIEGAKSLAITDEEKSFNEYQARNQITIWGPNANILDYANKQWAGMISDYYKPRWQLFIDYLNKSLTDKTPFNQNDYNKEVFEKVELKFVNQNQIFTTKPKGDPIITAKSIYEKYRLFFDKD